MYKTIALIVSIATLFLLTSACSKAKPPGVWLIQDTNTGDAFYSMNFVNETVGWLNGQTDRSSIVVEEEENAEVGKGRKAKKTGSQKPKEDPLKANQGFEVLQTTDGGLSWKPITDQFKHKIRSVWFVDPLQGWALTIDRNILHTADGGANWALQRKAGTITLKLLGYRQPKEIEQPEQIDGIFFLDAQHGWAWGGGRKDEYADQPGIFLVTVDGGQNWNSVPYPFQHSISDIFFLDAQHAWASSLEGAFYQTSDGGLNWAKIQAKLPEDVFRSVFFITESEGWGVGRSGRLAKTTDGGRTWAKIYKIKDQFKMRDIFFTDRNHGWAVGDEGAILFTPDGGETWVNASQETPQKLIGVAFVSKQAGWAYGLDGAFLRFQPGDQ